MDLKRIRNCFGLVIFPTESSLCNFYTTLTCSAVSNPWRPMQLLFLLRILYITFTIIPALQFPSTKTKFISSLKSLLSFKTFSNSIIPISPTAQKQIRIARAAYAAEDAIESHIYDLFTNSNHVENMSSDSLFGALEKVIEEMALIEKEAMEMRETVEFKNQLHTKSTPPADSSRSTSSSIAQVKSSKMVGADGLLLELKDKLTSNSSDLQTIPIVGMGGSGKTTLSLNIYEDGLIKEHFDVRAWVTISQEYSIRQILIQLLAQLNHKPDQGLSDGELGEMLHKHIYGRKYMIVLDDMWSLTAWDGVRRFLPNNKNGSRIVITTRLTTLASSVSKSDSLGMKFLDESDSWDLLSKTVFGEKDFCPLELEAIGKKIGKNCKGLPLSIAVVGGVLAKSEQTIEYWENVEENLNAIVNLEDEQSCLKTLYMSYKKLPVHLKPCFLYMGIYREDYLISLRDLNKLWAAEGFLKTVNGERPEDVARAYIKDLIDRNLVLIHKLGSIGSVKYCKVHDLLRDLCLREAQKEGFYTIYPGHKIENEVSRIVMSSTNTMAEIEEIDALSSFAPLARSLILDLNEENLAPLHNLWRQLRIVGSNCDLIDNLHQLVNSRFFTITIDDQWFPGLIWLFWNLQTLMVDELYERINVPDDIWYMSNFRHLHIDFLYLPDPPPNIQANGIVLENLQSLGWIKDFRCSEQVVKKIPNIRKLKLSYKDDNEGVDDRFCLANLSCLAKLESLNCRLNNSMRRMNFPSSLKRLSLEVGPSQCWQDILDKIGALPLLQKLDLNHGSFKEGEWETSEGQFRSLIFLSLWLCDSLRVWISEASHFPRLEQLHLQDIYGLEEIPLDYADISALRLIYMDRCCDSVVESAKRILEEQEALYGEEETTLQVQLDRPSNTSPAMKSLASRNFTFV